MMTTKKNSGQTNKQAIKTAVADNKTMGEGWGEKAALFFQIMGLCGNCADYFKTWTGNVQNSFC